MPWGHTDPKVNPTGGYATYGTLGKLPPNDEPQFSCLYNGDDTNTGLTDWCVDEQN